MYTLYYQLKKKPEKERYSSETAVLLKKLFVVESMSENSDNKKNPRQMFDGDVSIDDEQLNSVVYLMSRTQEHSYIIPSLTVKGQTLPCSMKTLNGLTLQRNVFHQVTRFFEFYGKYQTWLHRK